MREMKPAFALDFRDDTVSLLHRSGGGWQLVGAVPLDTPDLPEALTYLRSTALGLSPKGIATKLIIPNEQILYTWVHAPAATAQERHAQIVSGLEGRTPYDVADLAFDYSGDGPDVLVAVIAKETLAEAEAFAAEHRFNPLSFVAVPDTEDFAGEPWFGPTAAADQIAKGKSVERDSAAVVITPRAAAAEPEAVPAPLPEPGVAPAEIEAPLPEPELPLAPEIEIPAAPEPAPLPAPEPVAPPRPDRITPAVTPEEIPQSEPFLPPAAEPEIIVPKPPEPKSAPELPQAPIAPRAEPPKAFEAAKATPATMDERTDRELAARLGSTLSQPIKQPERPLPPAPVPRPAPVEVEEAPMALDVQPEDTPEEEPQGRGAIKAALSAQSVRVTDTKIDDELPPAPSTAAMMAFNTRRQDGAGPAPAKPAKTGAAPALGGAEPGVARPAPKAAALAATKPAKPAKPSALSGMGAFVGSAALQKRQKVDMPKASVSAAATLDAPRSGDPAAPARKPLTKGPGGFALREPARGKPRYLGLILTVVLLFLLAMIAAWSSYSLGAWNLKDSDAVQTAGQDPAASDVPDVNDEMLADMQDPEALADGQGTDGSGAEPQADATEDAALPEATAEVAAVDPAVEAASVPVQTSAEQAVTAQAPAAAPDGTQDEIFLAGMDAPPSAPDPLSLPLPEARGDPLPTAEPAPPPFGTVYQFNPDGTIQPTPEGIITPEGVMLRAGKPPKVPAERPAAVTAAASAAAPLAPATTAAEPEAAVTPVFADPALAGKLPKLRPADLVPPAAPADQGSLAPAADSRFASLRPQARPTTVLAAGEAARQATAAATLSASAATADTSNSPLAVAISRKPAARPRDMSRAVEAAIAVAMKTPAPAAEPEPAPAPEKVASKAAIRAEPAPVEADGEPEVAASNRKTPLKTTVAKQATFKNAINLSKINLIGVYGTQSKRYALVRQANGRYKKVRVGDNIDGGRVAAITATEVRYQKGSRLISLALPAG
jgi:Tfp pilus assembly protein PilP